LKYFENEKERKVFIIGGGEIYKMALDSKCLDEMYITYIDGVFDADTFFPEFDESNWKSEVIGEQIIDEKHGHAFVIKKFTAFN
jgi:dihydrofolate reductase